MQRIFEKRRAWGGREGPSNGQDNGSKRKMIGVRGKKFHDSGQQNRPLCFAGDKQTGLLLSERSLECFPILRL
jgi:hypothetical protein